MKLKTIASIFNRNKYLNIITTPEDEQWLYNGSVMYSLRGMPNMTPPMIFQIFDVPPEKQSKWICHECEMPDNIEYEDNVDNETDIEPMQICINYQGIDYLLFQYKQDIYSFNMDYIKPLLDEPDYLAYYGRKMKDGRITLACKVGFELKAIIMPEMLNAEGKYIEEIKRIARIYTAMEMKEEQNTEYEFFKKNTDVLPSDVDPETGEVMDGQESFGLKRI